MKYLRKIIGKWIGKKDMPFFIATLILGTISHFLYQFSGGMALAALFCPVNESTWEHLKLLFFPFLFVSIWTYLKYRPSLLKFFYSRFLAVSCGMLSIVMLFYTYTGILGQHFLILDLFIFVLSIFFTFYLSSYFYKKMLPVASQAVIFSLWILVSVCFFAFTCYPPNIPLFFPPA